MLGVVLCGGLSSRMGSDKGLMQKGKCTWGEWSYVKLKSLPLVSFLSVNEQQMEKYSKFFPQDILIVDSEDVKGPLKGILSVHKKFPSEDLLVIACDMQELTDKIIRDLIATYELHKDSYDFFVFRNDGYYEALCGVYTSKGLKNIMDRKAEGKLDRFSMQYILETGNTYPLSIHGSDMHCFSNYNERHQIKDFNHLTT